MNFVIKKRITKKNKNLKNKKTPLTKISGVLFFGGAPERAPCRVRLNNRRVEQARLQPARNGPVLLGVTPLRCLSLSGRIRLIGEISPVPTAVHEPVKGPRYSRKAGVSHSQQKGEPSFAGSPQRKFAQSLLIIFLFDLWLKCAEFSIISSSCQGWTRTQKGDRIWPLFRTF